MRNQVRLTSQSGKVYEYSKSAILRKSSLSETYRCHREGHTQDLAIEVFTFDRKKEGSDELIEFLRNEIRLQICLSNSGPPLFVHAFDFFEDKDKAFLVTELVEKSLLDWTELTGTLSISKGPESFLRIAYQMGLAILYLHSKGIALRKVDLEDFSWNCGNLKFSGFYSCIIANPPLRKVLIGETLAPEASNNRMQKMFFQANVWGLNACLYRMMFGKYFSKDKDREIPDLPELIPEVRDLLQKGFIENPFERPSLKIYLLHPAFNLIRKDFSNYSEKIFAEIPLIEEPNLSNLTNIKVSNVPLTSNIEESFPIPKEISTKSSKYQVLIPILNFRNNLLIFETIASWAEEFGINRAFGILLRKRHLQELALVIQCLTTSKEALENLDLEPQKSFGVAFATCSETSEANKLINLLKRDMVTAARGINFQYTSLYQTTKDQGIFLPSIRLGLSCGSIYESFLKTLMERYWSLNKGPLPENIELPLLKLLDFELRDRLSFIDSSEPNGRDGKEDLFNCFTNL